MALTSWFAYRGLADTVRDVSSDDGCGFSFGPMDVGHFSAVLDRALGLFQYFPAEWRRAQRRAMAEDNSWQRVASHYSELYHAITWA